MGSQTTAERSHLAWRCATCCLRRYQPPRPLRIISFAAQYPTPHDRCVRFAPAVTGDHATLATGRLATALPSPDFHRLDRASFAWRTEQVFFVKCTPNGVVAGALDDIQFHDSLLQQLQRPPACGLWAVGNRPTRSTSPRLPRQRCVAWPRPANACGSGRPPALLPPVADGCGRSSPG